MPHKKFIDIGGKLTEVDIYTACHLEVLVRGSVVRTARTEGDGYEDVDDPARLIEALRDGGCGADIFTFPEMNPDARRRYGYPMEWESIAALRIDGFDHWWHKQIPQETRTGVRKAEKKGISVAVVPYTDELVRGIQSIYNESPVRQGKPFWHYGKDLETLRKIHAPFLDSSDFLGAYFKGELVGFLKLVYSRHCAGTMNILSKIEHRDKRVMNALVAKAVEVCSARGIPYFTYCMWSAGGLGEFKIRNGFQKIDLPRYYVPLTAKGRIAFALKLHRGVRGMLPPGFKAQLVELRSKWNAIRTPGPARSATDTPAPTA
jgi:hypothetical protein